MFFKVKSSLQGINYLLYLSLLIKELCPAIWLTVRVYILGNLPGEYSFSIAGQLSWINLIYEILSEGIILPLYYFMGEVKKNKDEFINRARTGLVISFLVYLICSIIICIFTKQLLSLMATNADIIDDSAIYIRIESIANIFSVMCSYLLVTLITLSKTTYVYILTFSRMVLSIIFDVFLVSTLKCSANLGVNGIGYSNIIVNVIILIVSIAILYCNGYNLFQKEKISLQWLKDLFKIGGLSGFESFVRNLAYMLMISRMVNVVNEQGTYWVANNFIWMWVLLPVNTLGELIKQEVSTEKHAIQKNTIGYFIITTVICLIWMITIPAWKPFFKTVLAFDDVDKLYKLVLTLIGFYVLYAYQNIFDATFYGLGKTNYMVWETIITNTIYYGIAFILYWQEVWIPSLKGIALMFGIGIAFDSVVSLGAYIILIRKYHYDLLQTDFEDESEDNTQLNDDISVIDSL